MQSDLQYEGVIKWSKWVKSRIWFLVETDDESSFGYGNFEWPLGHTEMFNNYIVEIRTWKRPGRDIRICKLLR